MGSSRNSRIVLVAVLAVVAVGGAVAALLYWRSRSGDSHGTGFREVATEAGLTWRMNFLSNEQGETFKINLYDHGCGLAVADFDGDGKEDIYFCNQLGKNALYHNNGDGTFTDVAQEAGVALGDRVCVAATWADYLNEGRPSLFVTSTRGGNVLFHNLGGGKFVDVTEKAGLKHVGHSQAAVWFDYDGDGRLDLFLTNTAEWTTEEFDKERPHWIGQGDFAKFIFSPREQNILYHNNGDGTFTDVTEKSGLKGLGWAGDAVAFDYDGDGKIDLFVTNMFGRCQLYRNKGDGSFEDVTLAVLGRTPYGGMGAKLFDYNNDGRLALYVVDMHSDMWMGADFKHDSLPLAVQWEKKKYQTLAGPTISQDPASIEKDKEKDRESGIRHEELLFGNACYRNEGGGKFSEVSDAAGLENFWPWGIATGDFDNDGFEDVFVTSGMGYPFYYWGNYLLMNQGDGTFRNRADDLGIEPPARGKFGPAIAGKSAPRSVAAPAVAGDFRGVGKLDVVTNNFNDQPYYFKNELPRRNYVQFRLQGTTSNRDAIGAVVRLYRGDQVLTRQVQAACGYLSHSSKVLHFGLGDSTTIDRVEVTWPGTTKAQVLRGVVNVNALNEVIQPKGYSSRPEGGR